MLSVITVRAVIACGVFALSPCVASVASARSVHSVSGKGGAYGRINKGGQGPPPLAMRAQHNMV